MRANIEKLKSYGDFVDIRLLEKGEVFIEPAVLCPEVIVWICKNKNGNWIASTRSNNEKLDFQYLGWLTEEDLIKLINSMPKLGEEDVADERGIYNKKLKRYVYLF